jgi:hypothetical protein
MAMLAAPLPASSSLAIYEPARKDQGESGSCTAASGSGMISTALRRAGTPLAFEPSPCELYSVTRSVERAGAITLAPLTDSGAQLSDVIEALSVYGVAPMRGPTPDGRNYDIWTPDEGPDANVNAEPDFAQLEQAATTIITGTHRIEEAAPDVVDQVAAAIAAGFPVYTAFFCDSAFESLTTTQIAGAPNQSDTNGGGHAVYLSGYDTASGGSRVFTLTNSWGTSWCLDGRCMVSEAWLRAVWDLLVGDVRVVT